MRPENALRCESEVSHVCPVMVLLGKTISDTIDELAAAERALKSARERKDHTTHSAAILKMAKANFLEAQKNFDEHVLKHQCLPEPRRSDDAIAKVGDHRLTLRDGFFYTTA